MKIINLNFQNRVRVCEKDYETDNRLKNAE